MKRLNKVPLFFSPFSLVAFAVMLLAGLVAFPSAASAQGTKWYVQVGAESNHEAKQADAFLPNEIWIYVGDSITFKWAPKSEIHTVTFLEPGQDRPFFVPGTPAPAGCSAVPGEGNTTPNDSTYNPSSTSPSSGLVCVNSGPKSGSSPMPYYTVKFTQPGNYKFVCLVHTDMNGVVHVMQNTNNTAPYYMASLPYDQADYDAQAKDEAHDLLNRSITPAEEAHDFAPMEHVVLMAGEMSATAGGRQYLSIVRFFPGTIHIHAGETVEWINTDPTEPHTVTFGNYAGPAPLPTGVTKNLTDADALEATITHQGQILNSGLLQASPADALGAPQNPPGVTRIRITFTKPGIYHYRCDLHDVDGMYGTVVVLP